MEADQLEQLLLAGDTGAERLDGNNVDIDAEMGRLSNNALLYNAYTQILASRIGSMRSAITSK